MSEVRRPKAAAEVEEPVRACRPEEAVACLLGVAQELNSAATLKAGLQRFADQLKQYVDYETLGVLLLDDLGRELRFELAVGFPPEVVQHWRFGMGQGIVGTAAKSREIVVVDDVATDPRYINAVDAVRSEIALPLVFKGHTVGVLDIGGPRPGFFTAEDRRLLSFMADHLAGAIENARLYQNMRDQAQSLSLLHEVSRELSSILDRPKLLRRVAGMVERLIDYDVFTVMLWNDQTRMLEPSISLRRDGEGARKIRSIPLGHGITGTAAALRQPLRVPNVHLEPRYIPCVDDDIEVRSELAVPLVFKDRLLGVLDLECSEYDAFSARHQQLLSTLASSLAIALENARLYEKLQEDERRLNQDLLTAREVQKQLLPRATPWVRGVQIAVAYEPARHLAGDFYDFLPYGDGKIALAVGDVAGKATSAALYGSLAVGMLREYATHSRPSPARLLADLNDKLGRLDFDNRFLALAFVVYDIEKRRLTLANSGLPHPYRVRRRKVEKIDATGVPLGLLPQQSYRETELDLRVGDALVISSDGVEETLDPEEREFGLQRTVGALQRLAGGSARDIADGLLGASRLFAGDAEAYDDRTVLVIKAVSEGPRRS